MATREKLQKLVDSLPEVAMEAAQRALLDLQIWPPGPPPDMASMRKLLEYSRLEMQKSFEERFPRRPGMVTGFTEHGGYDPTLGTGSSAMQTWDGDTFIVQTYRQHKGHDLMVIERMRVQDGRLIFKHEITGPGDKHDEREIFFDLPAN